MRSILIFHKDAHIGPAIGSMIQGIKIEKKLPDIKIGVKQDLKFYKLPNVEWPSLVIFDEQLLNNEKIPKDLQFTNEKCKIIIISKSGKVSKNIVQNNFLKDSKVIVSPIERKELSKIIVPLFKIKQTNK